jgi:hypothetical protein
MIHPEMTILEFIKEMNSICQQAEQRKRWRIMMEMVGAFSKIRYIVGNGLEVENFEMRFFPIFEVNFNKEQVSAIAKEICDLANFAGELPQEGEGEDISGNILPG